MSDMFKDIEQGKRISVKLKNGSELCGFYLPGMAAHVRVAAYEDKQEGRAPTYSQVYSCMLHEVESVALLTELAPPTTEQLPWPFGRYTEEQQALLRSQVMVVRSTAEGMQGTPIVVSRNTLCYIGHAASERCVRHIANLVLDKGFTDFNSTFKNDKDHPVANHAWCEAEQKWYGWSHRAMYGFGIGSTCKMGDAHFVPSTLEDAAQDMLQFWGADDYHKDPTVEITDTHIIVRATYTDDVPNEALRGTEYKHEEAIADIQLGRGEWVAETLEDALQMAKDFAEGVS